MYNEIDIQCEGCQLKSCIHFCKDRLFVEHVIKNILNNFDFEKFIVENNYGCMIKHLLQKLYLELKIKYVAILLNEIMY